MIAQLKEDIKGLDALEILTLLDATFAKQAVFSTSFGIEDQVITHMLAQIKASTAIFTLDTGRLFPETYYVWSRTIESYNLNIKAYFPNTEAVEKLISSKGPASFYESVENRKECCYIRKIEPLKRAINSYQVWITGIRAEAVGKPRPYGSHRMG